MEKDLKRVYVTQDDYGQQYVIPYEDKDLFKQLREDISVEIHEGTTDTEWNTWNDAVVSFENRFSQYATGGDINLIELYARI